jgi:hypothetical protein
MLETTDLPQIVDEFYCVHDKPDVIITSKFIISDFPCCVYSGGKHHTLIVKYLFNDGKNCRKHLSLYQIIKRYLS